MTEVGPAPKALVGKGPSHTSFCPSQGKTSLKGITRKIGLELEKTCSIPDTKSRGPVEDTGLKEDVEDTGLKEDDDGGTMGVLQVSHTSPVCVRLRSRSAWIRSFQ